MKKKFKLDIKPIPEYKVFSITSTLKDYKLVFNLNNQLDIHFKRIKDFYTVSHHKKEFKYALFEACNAENPIYLLCNRSKETMLIPALRQTDYFFILSESLNAELINTFLKKIKSIPNVITIYEMNLINNSTLISIINDLELFMIE